MTGLVHLTKQLLVGLQHAHDAGLVRCSAAHAGARGGAPDPRDDLFALGVIVYEMLAGKQPFDGSSTEIVIANLSIDPPRERAHVDVDPLLEAFARKLMARCLRDRFASARAALGMLELIERDRDAASELLGVPYVRPLETVLAKLRARQTTTSIRAVVPRRRWPLVAGAVVILGAALGWHVMRPHKAELIEVLR